MWSEVPGWGLGLDIGFLILTIVIAIIWTSRWQKEKQKGGQENDSVQERQLGFSAISNQVHIGLIAASILLPACLIIITLGRHEVNPLPAGSITQIIVAAIYFTTAICVGFWNSASYATLVGAKNIARETIPNVLAVLQLFLTLFGAIILFTSLLIA